MSWERVCPIGTEMDDPRYPWVVVSYEPTGAVRYDHVVWSGVPR